jgi:translation initiation factor 2B subunit (eIF-2B alpha/beta/delta family)
MSQADPRQIVGSRNVALATAALMQNVVRSMRFSTIDELIEAIRSIGKLLNEANPKGECGLRPSSRLLYAKKCS